MRLDLPTAILAGAALVGALVGTGLYAGLRAAHAAPAGDAAPAAAPVLADTEVQARAVAAVEAQRASLRAACPGRADVTLDVTFAADGSQVMRGVRVAPVDGQDASSCALARMTPLRLPPIGARRRVRVPLALP